MPLKVISILVDSLLEGVISLFIQESKTGWMLMLISCGKITNNFKYDMYVLWICTELNNCVAIIHSYWDCNILDRQNSQASVWGSTIKKYWKIQSNCSCDEMIYFLYGICYRKKSNANNIAIAHYI